MFRTPHVLMTLAKATLKRTSDDEGVLHRQVDAALTLDPFPQKLALELGRDIAGHLYDRELVRPELKQVTLDPRVEPQCVTVCAGVDGSVPIATIRNVEIGPIVVTRCEDEDAGTSWLKATIKARFDFAPKTHRDFIATCFGDGLYWSFEKEQLGLLDEAGDDSVQGAVRRMQSHLAEDGATATLTGPDGKGVEITKDSVKPVDRKGAKTGAKTKKGRAKGGGEARA